MTARIYLDHNATTPVRPEVMARLAELGDVGNPSAAHEEGQRARALLEEARGRVAAWAGVLPEGVIFTSGCTEANALAVHALMKRAEKEGRPRTFRMNAGSHPSVKENLLALGEWKPGPAASVHFELANHNQSGWIFDLDAAVASALVDRALLHVDGAQIPGKTDVTLALRLADAISISGHKIGAPMGAGALILPRPWEIDPLWRGGGQEFGRRSGTPPLAAIVGLGVAIGLPWDRAHCRGLAVRLRDRVIGALGAKVKELSRCETGLPGTLLLAFEGARGDLMSAALDSLGIAASYGSACSSGERKPSASLMGLGIPEADARSAIRFSIGLQNTAEEIDEAASRIGEAYARVADAHDDVRRRG